MGMSEDYLEAIKFGATFVRIGSSIFGQDLNVSIFFNFLINIY